MSFVEGETVTNFLEGKISQALRNLVGSRLVELYYFQLHRLKAVHADHHPGNYLLQPDGRVGLVDFGCIKRITFDVTDLIRCCVAQNWRESEQEAKHVLRLVFGPDVPYSRSRKMLSTLDDMAEALYPKANAKGTLVDFGEPKLLNILTRTLKSALRDKLTNPEFAFTSRADLGLYSLLHQLRAKVNCKEIWQRVSA